MIIDAERRLLRRARVRLTLQVAGAITLVVLALGSLSYYLTVDRQQEEIDRTLTYALDHATPSTSVPCLWLFVERNGVVERPNQAPPEFPLASAPAEYLAPDGTVYAVRTERRGDEVRQAVFDERYQRSDRKHLLTAVLIAELAGLCAAVVTGMLLAGRAISPLSKALAKQRRFVADASHELRTPLTRLHTRAQLLLHQHSDEVQAEVSGELARLVADTGELGAVIDDLLLSASLRSDPPNRRPVDLAALAADVVEAERPRAEDRLLTVDLDATAPAPVCGVPSALRRMISGLVDNAVGHTRPGGHVTVAVRPAGQVVELTVSDDGIGLEQGEAKRIFARFAHGNGGTGRRFGLGLALVREVVESHRGTISATGRPGAGATFTVRIPVPPETTARAAELSFDTLRIRGRLRRRGNRLPERP